MPRPTQMSGFFDTSQGPNDDAVPFGGNIFLGMDEWQGSMAAPDPVQGPYRNATIGFSLPGGQRVDLTRSQLWTLTMRLANQLDMGLREGEVSLGKGMVFKGLGQGDLDILRRALDTHPDVNWKSQPLQGDGLDTPQIG